MKYTATVRSSTGTEEKRVVDAASRFAVYEQIEKEGGAVISLQEGGKGIEMPNWTRIQLTSGVKIDERIVFAKNLAAMLKAGLPLSRALSVIERQSTNKNLKRIVAAVEESVKSGMSLHEALAVHSKVFSALFIAMTKAGEESGTLADALKVIARQMERTHTLQKKVKGAMMYPSIILMAIVVIGVLMLMYVVPTLSATFESFDAELPVATQVIIGVSNFMASHVLATLLIVFFFFLGLFLFFRSKIGSTTLLFVALRMPVIGELVKETHSARVSRTLASLLSSGVEMLNAISIAEEVVGDNVFGKVVKEAGVRVKKGEPLSAAFAQYPKLYPIFMADMIAVGEETGTAADMLSQVAEYYEVDVEDRTKDLSTIIEPLLMLFIGGVVGVFALSMIAPIYSLSESI